MNVSYANTLPMREILRKLKLPDLSKDDNRTVVELVQDWLQGQGLRCTEADALHWLKFNIGYPSMVDKFRLPAVAATELYSIAFKTALQEKSLVRYVLQKGFTHAEAKRIFKQVYVLNKSTGKEFRALGMRNEDGGYALYSPHLEAHTAPVSVSFIRGEHNDYQRVYIFKTPFDYRRALQTYPDIAMHDSIILHAYGCIDDAATYLRGFNYQRLYTIFDNSAEGQRATEALQWLCTTERQLPHYSLLLPPA